MKIRNILKEYLIIKKAEKLNISKSFVQMLIANNNIEEFNGALDIIYQAKDKADYLSKVANFQTKNSGLAMNLLCNAYFPNRNYNMNCFPRKINVDNFFVEESEKNTIINNIGSIIIDLVKNDNKVKNVLLFNESGKFDYTMELDDQKITDFFSGDFEKYTSANNKVCVSFAASKIEEVIFNVLNNYPKDYLLNHINFVRYDMINNKYSDKSCEDRFNEYSKNKNLNMYDVVKIDKLNVLKSNILKIKDNSLLLEEVNNYIESDEKDEVNNVFLDYEVAIREELINQLYIPQGSVEIDNFEELRPQLLHMFIRNTDKFKDDLMDKADSDSKKILVEKQLDQSLVNITYDADQYYSDSLGLFYYKSNTTNQLSTSFYSSEYFLNKYNYSCLGIGFNSNTLSPENIALISDSYITSNKGMYNIEVNDSISFTVSDLMENDGSNEVLLYRRTELSDTKAAYVFVTLTGGRYDELHLEKGKYYSEKNDLPLVIYNLPKIKDSFNNIKGNSK